MRDFIVFGAVLAATAALSCARGPARNAPAAQASTAQIRTIDDVDPRPVVMDPPPTLKDEAPPFEPTGMPWEQPQVATMSPEDEKLRSALPFSPAIAMDPIDGSKISIRATTPTFDYKGRIYYFSSAENRAAFASNPESYMKATFTKL